MDQYDYLSKKLFYEENGPDFGASKLRKLTALNFYSAVELKEDNRFVCDLLRTDLETYGKIVDGDVDNYKAKVQDLLPNNFQGRFKQWKCSVTANRVGDILSNLPCARNGASTWEAVNCSKSQITDGEVRIFKDVTEQRRKVASVQPKVFSIFQPKTKREELNKKDEIVKKPPFKRFDDESLKKPVYKRTEDEIPRKPVYKRNEDTKEPEPQKTCGFKTAGEEFRQQTAKKYGKDAVYSYGTVKKNLGSRGGGVNAKFTPPVLRNEEEQEKKSAPNSQDSDVDERLKNIDPKMIEIIQNEIMDSGPKLSWDDIAGLEFAKNTIQEVVVWPMLRPDIFTGLRRPPRGILLFGPPGTGKTLIGKCIASQSGATFLSISASSLTSKWVGDGEKMVRALFAVARVHQPSVVFIDEIDSLLSQRSDTEHESSRRIKTEFLVQLDGVGTGDEDKILIIGATNRPQELDEAARRRLVKRLYIPLPETSARAEIIRSLINNERHTLTEANIDEIAHLTEGYSGADMKHVCQEASLGPIRSIPAKMICNIDTSQVRPVDVSDFKSALTRVKSTVSPSDLHNYLAWDKQFGCGSL